MAEPIRLSVDEIESMTGIPRDRPRKQCNRLRKWGIKAEVNARREVVCFHAWIEAAARKDIGPVPVQNDDDDIGLDLDALNG